MGKNFICHIEWSTTDLAKTSTFLEQLFGWAFTPFGDSYLVFKTPEGGPGGGLNLVSAEEHKPGGSPTAYIWVDEIEPYLPKAEALGGTVTVPKTEISTVGWFAHITDSVGNTFGLFQTSQTDCPDA